MRTFRLSALGVVAFYAGVWMPALMAQISNIQVNFPGDTDPEEVVIAVNPANPMQLAAGANLNYHYRSFDGGQSWAQGRLTSQYGVWGDPCVIFDVDGNLYYGHLSNPSTGYFIDRIVVQKSVNGGETWSTGVGIGLDPPKQQDKEWLAADITDSPFRNRLYMAWTEFDSYGSTNPKDSTRILFSYSSNSGVSWAQPVRVSDRGGDCIDSDMTVEGAVPAVGPNGEVYASWAGPLGIMFDKSLDGGEHFGKDVFVVEQPGGWDINIWGIYRCNGLPVTACDISHSPYRGTIYILWADYRNGTDYDVYLIKSTDGGNTWGDVKRVNDDNTHRNQFFPWMAVDPITGTVWVVFYDRRNWSNESTDVFVARSNDGGETFTNFEISTSAFIPVRSVFFGDYIGIAAWAGEAHPIWARMDNRQLSVWTAVLNDTTAVSLEDGSKTPSEFALEQNYPNPFNTVTTLVFSLPGPSNVRISVIDPTGRVVAGLAEGLFGEGRHSMVWDAADSPSGVYAFRIDTELGSKTRKCVLLR